MVTQVQLGNFFSSNGKTVLGGVGGSGLDTESLVKSLTDARRITAVKLEDKIKVNDSKAAALSEFKTLLSKFKDAANFLRNAPGVANAADNIFKYASATVVSDTDIAGSTYVSITAEPGAIAQNYSITEIESIAQGTKQRTNAFAVASADISVTTSSATAGFFKAGSMTVKGKVITLATGDSLNSIAAKFNAVSDDTKISATVVQIASGSFALNFTQAGTGTANAFDLTNAGTVTDTDSVLANLTFATPQAASNAVFTIDGVEITRQTNSIGDVINGLTFNLLNVTPTVSPPILTVSVENDEKIAKNGIINFANAYNDLKIFAAKQTELADNGKYSADAVLATDQNFRSALNNINSELSSIVSGISGSNPSRLADIGITFTDLPESQDNPFTRNILTVDSAKLESALATNFSGVRKVFEFVSTSSNANIRVFSRTNALTATSFTLTVTISPGANTFQATYNNGSGPVTVNMTGAALSGNSGYTVRGQDGTALEGLVLVYAGTTSTTATIATTQGIADKVFNVMDGVLKQNTGSLAMDQQSIKDSSAKLNDEIKKIDDQVATYREQLLAKFAALEKAIAQVNNLLTALDAQAKARQAAAG